MGGYWMWDWSARIPYQVLPLQSGDLFGESVKQILM
jgi:hypothetical protein